MKATLTLVLLVLVSPAWANKLNVTDDGVAIHGYDLVEYFSSHEAVQGEPSITISYQGADYWFSSIANRELFQQQPESYLPEYGGYCAFGVRLRKKFDIDPTAFALVDDKLYFLLNQGTQHAWLEERDKNIKIADSNWPAIQNVPGEMLTTESE